MGRRQSVYGQQDLRKLNSPLGADIWGTCEPSGEAVGEGESSRPLMLRTRPAPSSRLPRLQHPLPASPLPSLCILISPCFPVLLSVPFFLLCSHTPYFPSACVNCISPSPSLSGCVCWAAAGAVSVLLILPLSLSHSHLYTLSLRPSFLICACVHIFLFLCIFLPLSP